MTDEQFKAEMEKYAEQLKQELENPTDVVIEIVGPYATWIKTEIGRIIDEDLCFNGYDKVKAKMGYSYVMHFDELDQAKFYLQQYYKHLAKEKQEGILHDYDSVSLTEDDTLLTWGKTTAKARVLDMYSMTLEERIELSEMLKEHPSLRKFIKEEALV